eukprot:6561752-Ditylum_brightwellii.AAC.1
MELDYSTPGEVQVAMKKYLLQIIEEFPEKLEETVTSPAAGHLFKINTNGNKLPEELSNAFHTAVAHLLFVCKHS